MFLYHLPILLCLSLFQFSANLIITFDCWTIASLYFETFLHIVNVFTGVPQYDV